MGMGPITPERMSQAMLDGLTLLVRDKIRERIMATIEPDIREAIDSALETFKASIETYRDPMLMRDTVRVLIERRDQTYHCES